MATRLGYLVIFMNDKTIEEIVDAGTTLGALAVIAFLATEGVTDFEILGLIAALGGYRPVKRNAATRLGGDN
jgi:hypothetical protein